MEREIEREEREGGRTYPATDTCNISLYITRLGGGSVGGKTGQIYRMK